VKKGFTSGVNLRANAIFKSTQIISSK